MTVTKEINESRLTVEIEGEVNTITAPELDTQIDGSIDGITELILDMTNVPYISSAGLRVIMSKLKLMKGNGGSMILRGVNEDIKEILDDTGMLDILTLE